MKKVNMLFITANNEAFTGLKTDELNITTVQLAETAIEKIHQARFDLVAIDEQTSASEKAMLHTLIQLQQPEASIVFFDNMEQLQKVVNEWIKNTKEQDKPSYSFIDNGFRNHFLYANDNVG